MDDPLIDPQASARAAGLRYVSDDAPGIQRVSVAGDLRYLDPQGRTVQDERVLGRIRSLAIPPAWRDVWICPYENGHLQAVGRDLRNRKQYRYHPRWREVRDEVKYGQMIAFGRALPGLRARVDADLGRGGLPREKALATVVRLLDTTLIRVGNAEYARSNESFGLTTLRDDHVTIQGSRIRFRFRGKSGVEHEVEVSDRRVARILQRMADLPGEELFRYVDEQGERRSIESSDVNAYLREATGQDFTAKHFRTWAGTVLAARALQEYPSFASHTEARRNLTQAIAAVAGVLGNTRTVCRKCYVHPEILAAYLEGVLSELLSEPPPAVEGLRPEEAATLRFLELRAASVAAPRPRKPPRRASPRRAVARLAAAGLRA